MKILRLAKLRVSNLFLFFDTFLYQMLLGMIGLTVPIYANMLGASTFLVGVIGSTGGLIYSFMPLVSGILCDRLRRKVFVSTALLFYGFLCILYISVEEPLFLALVKALESFSAAIFWPAIEALIADSAEDGLEKALKRFNISWSTAMVLGPLIGGIIINWFSIKAPFILSAITSLSFGFFSLIFVVEYPRKPKVASISKLKDESRTEGLTVLAFASIFLYSSVIGIITAIFPAYATNLNFLPYEIGLITFSFAAARAFTFYHALKIELKTGKFGMFFLGSLTLGLASLFTSNTNTVPFFIVYFLIFGFGAGVSYAVSISVLFRKWEYSRGYAAGVFESLIGLGYFIGPLMGGTLLEYIPNAPYLFTFILSLAVLSVQWLFKHGKNDHPFKFSTHR